MFEINNRFVDLRIVEAKLVRDLALNLTKDIELLLPCYSHLMENDIIACISFYINKENSIFSELKLYVCGIPGLEIHLKGSSKEISLVEIVITKSTLPESKYDFVSNLLLTIIKFYNGSLKIAEFKESGQDSESLMDKFVSTEKPKRYDNFAGIEFPTETTHAILDSIRNSQIEDNTEYHKAKASIEEAKAYKPTEPQFTILDTEELHPLDQHEVIQLEYLQSSLDLLKRLHLEDKDKEKGYSDGQIALYDATLNNMKHVIKSLLGK